MSFSASGAPSPTAWNWDESIVIYHGASNATAYGASGELLATTNYAIINDGSENITVFTTGLAAYSNFDAELRPQQATYLDGSSDLWLYDCCTLQTFTNREGTVTT